MIAGWAKDRNTTRINTPGSQALERPGPEFKTLFSNTTFRVI